MDPNGPSKYLPTAVQLQKKKKRKKKTIASSRPITLRWATESVEVKTSKFRGRTNPTGRKHTVICITFPTRRHRSIKIKTCWSLRRTCPLTDTPHPRQSLPSFRLQCIILVISDPAAAALRQESTLAKLLPHLSKPFWNMTKRKRLVLTNSSSVGKPVQTGAKKMKRSWRECCLEKKSDGRLSGCPSAANSRDTSKISTCPLCHHPSRNRALGSMYRGHVIIPT